MESCIILKTPETEEVKAGWKDSAVHTRLKTDYALWCQSGGHILKTIGPELKTNP